MSKQHLHGIRLNYSFIDNSRKRYASAAKAYNANVDASNDYIFLIHQDVGFLDREAIRKAVDYLSTFSKVGVAGVAGVFRLGHPRFPTANILIQSLKRRINGFDEFKTKFYRGCVLEGEMKIPWGGHGSCSFEKPLEVQTLDELLLIVPGDIFCKLKFDEKVIDCFHLYGTDYSLSVADLGFSPYVLPIAVWHNGGTTNIDMSFYTTLFKVLDKHKHERIVHTTMGFWPTSSLKLIRSILLSRGRTLYRF